MLGFSLLFGLLMVAVPDYVYAGSDKNIHFSRESGFYEESFYLEITGGKTDWTLYYTLDGSMPDMTSQQYTGPILMEDVSYKENVYSARRDVSPALCEEEMEKYEQNETVYSVPEQPVDKCNVVRVAAYDSKKNLAAEAIRVYYIGFRWKYGYDGMAIVSIVTEPDNLFDYETGIYVMGETYDQLTAARPVDWHFWNSNYFERGKEWERKVTVDIFDENKEWIFNSTAGIRIHGQGSRANPQKSFNLYARKELGGDSRFSYDLFENGIGPDKFVLSSGGNDDLEKARDYIVQTMVADSGLKFATMKMYPCVLFLNGEYWGVYYLSETYNKSYISDYYGIFEDDVIRIKKRNGDWELSDGNSEDMELYYEMEDFITTHDMTDAANFDKACEMIDIDSFVDYYATEIYIGNVDWPRNNVALWRARQKNENNSLADGRWRYMLFDTNIPSVFYDPSEDDIGRVLEADVVFAALMQNITVQQKFKDRISYLADEVFGTENYEEAFEKWYIEMSQPLQKNSERFFGTTIQEVDPYQIYYMDVLKTFLKERPAYMEQYMDIHFSLQ